MIEETERSQRTRWVGRKAQLQIFSGLSALFLVITTFLAAQLFISLDDHFSDHKENLAFSAAVLQSEHELFVREINSLPPYGDVEVGELHRWFSLLESRSVILMESPAYNELLADPNVANAVMEVTSALKILHPTVFGPPVDLIDGQAGLIAIANSLSAPIAAIAERAELLNRLHTQAEYSAITDKMYQFIALSAALLAALLSLLVLMWQLYRVYRRRALENRTTLNRLATILNTSQDAVMVVRPDGTIIDTNRAADSMFFAHKQSEKHRKIEQILLRRGEDDSLTPVTGKMLMKSCEKGPNLCSNLMGCARTGERFAVELSADRANRGADTVVICFVRNIARRMADQAELLAARDTALSGEKAKARFLGMISHEMRTPLNGLLGTLDLMEETELSRDQRRYLQIMQHSGQMLLTQINDALDITQAAQGGLTLAPERFDLDGLVSGLVRAQTLAASARGNTLHHLPSAKPLGFVMGDPNRIHQVLLNLISNANKFTRAGHITLETARVDANTVEFQIADTGIGIPKGDQSRIFDDFVRLDGGRSQSTDGTGLGLGIVRHLVELMGGDIGLDSTEGRGSLFWVRLPLQKTENTCENVKSQDTAALAPLDILVVEDNSINRMVITEMLSQAGHRVSEAADGVEGVHMAHERRYDLIIMDLAMPVMDGIEAATRIRSDGGKSSETKLIALSAHLPTDPPECFDQVLSKPLRRNTLKAALRGLSPSPVRSSNHAPFDEDHLAELRQTLSNARMRDLFDGFQAEGDKLIAKLPRAGLAPNNPEELAGELHSFAGLAATVGARPLQRALAKAQAALETGDQKGVESTLRRLPVTWKETVHHLSDLRKAA